MSSKLGTTLTHNNISTFDEGDSFVYYNLSGPARPNTINFGLYNSSNTQIIIGTLPLEGDVIYNPANAQTIDGFFQFENQDSEYYLFF